MQNKVTVALIISTYNWPGALELVLMSILAQTELPDEVLIADDGSGPDTKALIEKYKAKLTIPLKHIWHEDEGFRLAMIRNKALVNANSDYIVQIDGDIVLHPNFIQDHKRFAHRGTFVRASRVYINEAVSKRMIKDKEISISAFSNGITNFFSALRIPFLWPFFEVKYKNSGQERYEIHGCNMAFWREDALKINGYDEQFTGWGPEDKEFVARLINIGRHKRFIKLGAIAFHLHHRESCKTYLVENEKSFQETIFRKKKSCEFGINQYL